ncbi:hypothetical protein [Undibacterium sp. TJN19]|uniref:hypothetical protein n=1 Tax=Undibacterium sp. TJN19 TaxID=3413055 RepID=UPI003BF0E41E
MKKFLKIVCVFFLSFGCACLLSPYAFAIEQNQTDKVEKLLNKFDGNFRINFEEVESTLAELKALEPFFTKDQKDRVYVKHAAMLGFQGKHEERVKLINSYLAEVTDIEMKARFLGQLIRAYADLGEYEKAIEVMNNSMKLADRLTTNKAIANYLQGTINLLRLLKAYDDALTYANRILELKESKEERCLGILNTVELNFLRGDVLRARSLMPEADASCKDHGMRLHTQILQAMATIDLINSGNFEQGIELGIPLVADFELLNHKTEYRLRLEESLCKAFMAKNDLKSAEKYGKFAFEHAKSSRSVEQIETSAETMAVLKERQRNLAASHEYLKIAFEYRKRRTDDDIQKKLAYQRVKFNSRENAAHLSALEGKIQNLVTDYDQEKKSKQQLLWMTVSLALATFVFAGALLVFNKL